MNGQEIFLAFFIFFTLATLAVSIPLFPGNIIATLFSSLGIPVSFATPVLEAVANGLLYGFIIWIVYVSISRKLEESEEAANNLRRHARFCSPKGSANCPVHFGYLSKLPPGGSIPEECYNCPRIEQCLQG